MKDIEIRKAKKTESEELASAFAKAMSEDFLYYPKEAQEEFLKIWDTKFFRKKAPIVFVAKTKDRVAGFLLGRKDWKNSGVGYIEWLWVDKDFRHKNIGTNLLKEFENLAKELGYHKFYLNADSDKSKGFYEHVGFIKEGELKRHFWNLDELFYAKHIKR